MKKFLSLIVLILCLNIVEAGKTIPLDFSQKDSYSIPMLIGDRVAFSLKGNHTIILDKINNESIELDVFLFLETKHNPYYVFIDKQHSSKIDFERDGEKDLLVRLISFDDKKAIIEFTNLNVNEKENKFEFKDYMYWIIAGIIFVIILIVLYFRSRRKSQIDNENAGAGI